MAQFRSIKMVILSEDTGKVVKLLMLWLTTRLFQGITRLIRITYVCGRVNLATSSTLMNSILVTMKGLFKNVKELNISHLCYILMTLRKLAKN